MHRRRIDPRMKDRRVVILLLLALVTAGCTAPAADGPGALVLDAEEPEPPERIPVVRITSVLDVRGPDGEPWAPPHPGHHPCDDAFAIDEERKLVLVDDVQTPLTMANATVVISVQDRHPEWHYRNNRLQVPDELPFRMTLHRGNAEDAEDLVLSVSEYGILYFDGIDIQPYIEAGFDFEYDWVTENGTRLHVQEKILVTHLGEWTDPLTTRPTTWCP